MDIFLSINNREQVIQLPIVPSGFKISSPVNNNRHTTVNLGDLSLIGLRGLKELTIDSFFPSKDYPFSRDKTYKGWEYVEKIEAWIDRKLPIRLIVTNTPVNMLMVIENFEYGPQDGSGDIYYTLSLSQFREIQLDTRRV
ncbi:hypothetical protein MKZ20_20145 [Psychrobacillus sp. FSL K6-2684]|uniref:hypothetical protein n=1 Tax=Psychrobacillus sp. FSL K6-2684 TaxID=2921547 RepID=UPI0030F9B2CD